MTDMIASIKWDISHIVQDVEVIRMHGLGLGFRVRTLFNTVSHHIFTRRVLAHYVRTDTRRFVDPLHRTLLFLYSTLISAVWFKAPGSS